MHYFYAIILFESENVEFGLPVFYNYFSVKQIARTVSDIYNIVCQNIQHSSVCGSTRTNSLLICASLIRLHDIICVSFD